MACKVLRGFVDARSFLVAPPHAMLGPGCCLNVLVLRLPLACNDTTLAFSHNRFCAFFGRALLSGCPPSYGRAWLLPECNGSYAFPCVQWQNSRIFYITGSGSFANARCSLAVPKAMLGPGCCLSVMVLSLFLACNGRALAFFNITGPGRLANARCFLAVPKAMLGPGSCMDAVLKLFLACNGRTPCFP